MKVSVYPEPQACDPPHSLHLLLTLLLSCAFTYGQVSIISLLVTEVISGLLSLPLHLAEPQSAQPLLLPIFKHSGLIMLPPCFKPNCCLSLLLLSG